MTSGCVLLSHDIKQGFSNANPAELLNIKAYHLGYSALDEENWIAPISMKMVLSHHEIWQAQVFL